MNRGGTASRRGLLVFNAKKKKPKVKGRRESNGTEKEEEELYHIGRLMSKLGLRSPVGKQAGIRKLAIGTRTDSNENYSDIIYELQHKYIGLTFPQRKPQNPRKQGQTS